MLNQFVKWTVILIVLGTIAGVGPGLFASMNFNREIKESDENAIKVFRKTIPESFSVSACKESASDCSAKTLGQIVPVLDTKHSVYFFQSIVSELDRSLFEWKDSGEAWQSAQKFKMHVLERVLVSAKNRERNPVDWLAKDDQADFLKLRTTVCEQFNESLKSVLATDPANQVILETEKLKTAFSALCL